MNNGKEQRYDLEEDKINKTSWSDLMFFYFQNRLYFLQEGKK